jgi:hypothetical protein
MKQNIRKTGCTIGLIVIFTIPAFARVYWGVRAGVARSSLVQKIDLNYWAGSCLGYSVAGLADIPFYERFSFRPEIALVREGGSFHSEPTEEGLFLLKHGLRSYSLHPSFDVAFNIPISGVRMAIYAGPTLDFRLWDRLSTRKTEEEPAIVAKKETRPFDFGINTGISVEYKGVFFSITTLTGTLYRQMEKGEGESSVYQNNLTFSLGYIFR